ncbi:hypothetical protein BRD13_02070 [Halobacteriales archaeon SW_5_70_135]|nr:MAG: hypothetical protein BRD13_02070 [Halobacteriales archaeon SW_5_70_135]
MTAAREAGSTTVPVEVTTSGGSDVPSDTETTLTVINSVREFTASSYPVRAVASGTDRLVETTATLSVG